MLVINAKTPLPNPSTQTNKKISKRKEVLRSNLSPEKAFAPPHHNLPEYTPPPHGI